MSGLLSQIDGEIQAQITGVQGLAQDSKQAAGLWYKATTTLRAFLSELLNTDLSPASRGQTQAVNRNRFTTAFGMVKDGDVEAAKDLPGLAKAYLASLKANASTELEYRRAAAGVLSKVNFAAGISELEGANDDVLTTLYTKQIDVLTSLGNFLQLEGADISQLDSSIQKMVGNWDGTLASFKGDLTGLSAAIKQAQNFSYDNVLASLDVTLSLAGGRNVPAWLEKLAIKSGTNLKTTLDFIIRKNDLTPPMRWIATHEVSTHTKNLKFVLKSDLLARDKRLALATDSKLQRNLRLILTKDLDNDTRMIALAGSSDLTRSVNATLIKANSHPGALRLALHNIGHYSAHVKAVLDTDKFGKRTTRIVLEQQGSYAAMITAAVGSVQSDPVGARILLRQQGRYIANIGGHLEEKADWKRRLLINATTTAARIVTITAAFPGALTRAQKEMLTTNGGRIYKVIDAHLNDGSISVKGWSFLKKLNVTGPVNRVINGVVNADGLSGHQKTLLDAISGTSTGSITLGGTFAFTPEDAFGVYFDGFATGKTAIVNSMDTLGGLLGQLRVAVTTDTKDRQNAALLAKVQAVGANTAIRLDNRKNAAAGVISKIEALEAATGTTLRKGAGDATLKIKADGTIAYDASHISSSHNKAAWLAQFWNDGGLEDQIFVRNSLINKSHERLEKLRAQVASLGGVPAFSGGGHTGNAARSGGLDGQGGFMAMMHPQETVIDHTRGPSKSLFDTSRLEAEIRDLKRELASFKEQSRAIGRSEISEAKRQRAVLERFENDGMPETRT